MDSNRILSRSQLVLPILLGVVAFFAVVGPRALYTTNIGWLSSGDPATHFLGWHFFRSSDWSFPIGLNPEYGLELSNAILFSDSIPLFAFLFKPLSSALPETFQYSGLWLLVCFVLQAWFGWKLAGLISANPVIRLLTSGLFVFAPPMIWRLHGHFSLVAHFLILAALYLLLRPNQKRRIAAWAVLLAVAAMVHSYLLAMVAILWLTDMVRFLTSRQGAMPRAGSEVTAIVVIVALVCWQVGYFSVGSGVSASGYGFYRMNLLSLFDSSGWSYLLRDIPEAKGEYEGFNYLGLGGISVALFGLPALISGRCGFLPAVRKRAVILLPLVVLSVYALSNNIGIGSREFEVVSLPDPLQQAANVFRASGRMFWPMFYTLVLASIFIVVRGNKPRVAIVLLSIALVVQMADTSATWSVIRKKLMITPATEWASPLMNTFWEDAARKYEKVRWIQPGNHTEHWETLAAYAGEHGMGTDAVYLARVGNKELANARQRAAQALQTGKYEPDSLYVLDPALTVAAIVPIDETQDLIADVDGFRIIAPGWNTCTECAHVEGQVRIGDIVPQVPLGKRIEFSQSAVGVANLAIGWSGPEPWGTWSDGTVAKVVLPLANSIPKTILIESGAFVSPAYPRQDVDILVNDVTAKVVSLTGDTGNVIEVTVPEVLKEQLVETRVLRLEFRLPGAISPKDIGLSDDPRKLALGLYAITLN